MLDTPSAAWRSRLPIIALALPLTVLLFLGSWGWAAPPDLTSGGVPDNTQTVNLGAIGARGWIYNDKRAAEITGESRQILITEIDTGSPADAVLAIDDVILGADGTGATPVAFTADARRSLALAIADAEARNPGVLKLLRWRAGTTTTEQITLRTMGSYSATAPYNCPKSTQILQEGLQYFFANEDSGRYTFGALALLAAGDPAYAARVQTEARALIPSAATIAAMMSDVRDTGSTWERGHTLTFLAEYYLATNDTQVLPAIEAYAVNIAKNQSLFGTVGHIYAEKTAAGGNNGPMGGVYGVVNSTGVPCFLGLLLAKECGLTNAELDPAIERTSRFLAYYSGKGAIPYGEHEPYSQAHESNGKSGLAAIAFCLQGNRVEEGKFFAKMATASTTERERGHTGAFFNYLWAPLGANCGGEEAAAAYFSQTSWHFDLARRWDGSFVYDNLNGEGPDSGASYHNFKMSTAALLTYALPLRELRITGRGQDPTPLLSSADVTEAIAAANYNASSRSTTDLVTDLGNWSPVVRTEAAEELGTRSINASQLNQITALANDSNGTSRIGACRALGQIGDSSSAATLAALLTDPDNHVRFMAAEAMRYLPSSAKLTQLDTILAAADSTSQPLVPYIEEDPLHFAHGRLAMLLFYSGNAYGPKGILYNSLAGVDRNLLYPAIRSVAATPVGLSRSTLKDTYRNLTAADTLAVADAIVDSVHVRAPADKMFSSGVRQGGIEALQKYGFAEGVPLSMIYMEDDGRDSKKASALGVLEDYAGSATTVVPDPDVISYLQELLSSGQAAEAQAVLDAIANDPNPTFLIPLKSIQSVVPDSPTLTLPTDATVLRVSSTDYAQGDSVYTWRKIHGAGQVTFAPNGTGGAVDTAIQFDGTPGLYLFEVIMSDSRGLTEVVETVSVTLYNAGGTLPPNDPPIALPQSLTVTQSTPMPITLGGTDPESYALVYTVTGQPAHGSLSGAAPYLLFTPEHPYVGADSFTFEVMDSEGQVASATVDLTIEVATSFGVALYEPFDYPAGGLNGASGSSEVGLDGTWTASSTSVVVEGSLAHGALVTTGRSIGGLSGGSNRFGGARSVSSSALAGNGLLNDGGTLWFSVVMGYDTGGNVTNSRLAFALANDQFNSGNYNYWINDDGAQLGSGLGVTLGRIGSNGRAVTTEFRDAASGDGTSGNIHGDFTGTTYGEGTHGLIVGRITWGETPVDPDTIELFQPGSDLLLPTAPISTLSTTVDQSTFDTITWARGDKVVMDEVRFGATYLSVLLGTVAMTEDLTAPAPDPMEFASAPIAMGPSSITMSAVPAYDPTGVEYYFSCVAGGGNDSGWQDSASYTDTGLAPATLYSYRVQTRDRSPAQDATGWSGTASATTSSPPNDYATWVAASELEPADQGFHDDPDFDGLANGIEAWLGTNPLQDNVGLTGVSTDGLTSIFTHPQSNSPPTDVSVVYQWSINLAEWHSSGPGSGVTVTLVPNTVGTTTTVTATASEGLNKLFLRLGATQY